MKKAILGKQITVNVPGSVDMFLRGLAKMHNVSLNVVMNAVIEYAIAESTRTELDKYIVRNDDIISGRLVINLEDEDE